MRKVEERKAVWKIEKLARKEYEAKLGARQF